MRIRAFPRRLARRLLQVVGRPAAGITERFLRATPLRAGVALVYHGVEARAGDPGRELVPPHGVELFERQVAHLVSRYRIVPAADLRAEAAGRARGERFPVAITFDDDLSCHSTVALPVLRRWNATATFFLSGASLERPFSFWWERLQRAADRGLETAALVGSPSGSGIHAVARAVEELGPDVRDELAGRLAETLGPDPPGAGMRAAAVAALAEAGMTIGFHTQRHDALTQLDDEALRRAMQVGRNELETIAGHPLTTIGYPHGRADGRVAEAARAAGFSAGFTTTPRAVVPGSDPLLQGRVNPSYRSAGHLALQVVVALIRR